MVALNGDRVATPSQNPSGMDFVNRSGFLGESVSALISCLYGRLTGDSSTMSVPKVRFASTNAVKLFSEEERAGESAMLLR